MALTVFEQNFLLIKGKKRRLTGLTQLNGKEWTNLGWLGNKRFYWADHTMTSLGEYPTNIRFTITGVTSRFERVYTLPRQRFN